MYRVNKMGQCSVNARQQSLFNNQIWWKCCKIFRFFERGYFYFTVMVGTVETKCELELVIEIIHPNSAILDFKCNLSR